MGKTGGGMFHGKMNAKVLMEREWIEEQWNVTAIKGFCWDAYG